MYSNRIGSKEKKAFVRDDDATKLRRQLTKILNQVTPRLPRGAMTSPVKPSATKKTKPSKAPPNTSNPCAPTGAIEAAAVLAMVDEIRDAVVDVLQDDETLQNELLARINSIVGTLGR